MRVKHAGACSICRQAIQQTFTVLLLLGLLAGMASAGQTADRVLVIKSKERLYLMHENEDEHQYYRRHQTFH